MITCSVQMKENGQQPTSTVKVSISFLHMLHLCYSIGRRSLLRKYRIKDTVKPPLTDTSRRLTPLVSGHLVMFSATYKHYIFNLP